MFNFILRKTEFKDYDKEDQDRLIAFLSKKYLMLFYAQLIFSFCISSPLACLIIYCDLSDSSSITTTTFAILATIIGIFLIICFLFFISEINSFVNLMAIKLYCTFYTKKGNALTKKDFEFIEKENSKLYNSITSPKCQGKCYAVSYGLLTTLKTGNIKFVAVKTCDKDKKEKYTLHALYEKDGWVFDTYNQHQYPTEKCITMHEGIVWKDIFYKDIEKISPKDYGKDFYPELAKWCEEHDCYQEFFPKASET